MTAPEPSREQTASRAGLANGENAYELIIRGKNELGPALAEASGQLKQFGAQTSAAAAAVRPEFEAVRDRLVKIAEAAERTGKVGTESINHLKVALQQLSQVQQSTLSAAERNIFASATKTLPDAIRMTQQYNAVARETAQQVGAGSTALLAQGNAMRQVGTAGTSAFNSVKTAVAGFATSLLAPLAAIFTLAAAFAALRRALINADEMRDLAASIRAVSTSSEAAGRAITFFDENARRTRLTGNELAKIYGELLPQAMRRGFSEENFQRMTLVIANFATAVGKSAEEVATAWTQITSGRVTGTNPIVQALGLDPRAIQQGKVGLDTIILGMQRLALEGEQMGQSLTSTMKHVADALFDAFGRGFNSARGEAQTGMQGVLDALTDPQIISAIEKIGEAVAKLGPIIAEIAGKFADLVAAVPKFLESPTGQTLTKIASYTAPGLAIRALRQPAQEAFEGTIEQRAAALIKDFGQAAAAASQPVNDLTVKTNGLNTALGNVDPARAAIKALQDTAQAARVQGEILRDALSLEKLFTVPSADPLERELERISQVAVQETQKRIQQIQQLESQAAQHLAEGSRKTAAAELERANALQASVMQIKALEAAAKSAARENHLKKMAEDADKAFGQLSRQLSAIGASAKRALSNIPFSISGPALQEIEAALQAAEDSARAIKDQMVQAGTYTREAFADATQPLIEGAKETVDVLVKGAQRVAKELSESFTVRLRTNFSDALTDAIADFGATGGKNLTSTISAAIANGAKIGADALMKLLQRAVMNVQFPGAGGAERQPGESQADYEARQQEAQQTVGRYAGYAMGAYQMYGQVRANQAGSSSDLQTILATTITGAMIGNWVGAIVGFVVGVVSAIFSDAGAKDKYGIPSFVAGQARFQPVKNIEQREAEEIRQRMQTTFDTFYNGFARILLKVTTFIPQFIREFDIEFVRGLDRGGYIGREDSPNFLKHLDQLITQGIPSEVGKLFKPFFADAFETLGYSAARFEDLWDQLGQMDPQKGLQLLEALVDIGLGIQRFREFTGTGWNTTVGPGFDIQTGILQQEYERSRRTPAQALWEDFGERMVELAEAANQLTGEARITAMQELIGLTDQWEQAVRNIAREQLAAAQAVEKSYGATIRELELEGLRTAEGTPDVEAQLQYLQDYADELMAQLPRATSFAEVTQLSDEIRSVIMRIRQMGGAISPEADEAYRLWALENLRNVQQIALDRIRALGQEMADANARLRDAIDGTINEFLRLTEAMRGVGPGNLGGPAAPPGVPGVPTPEGGPPVPTFLDPMEPEPWTPTGGHPGPDRWWRPADEPAPEPGVREGETVGKPGEITKPGYEEGEAVAALREIRDLLALKREEELGKPSDELKGAAEQDALRALIRELIDEQRLTNQLQERVAVAVEAARREGVNVEGTAEFRVLLEDIRTGAPLADFTQRVQQTRATRGRRSV